MSRQSDWRVTREDSLLTMSLQRTYSSKKRTFRASSTEPLSPPSASPVVGQKRKRQPLEEHLGNITTPATKQPKLAKAKPRTTTPKAKEKPKYTQLHFNIDQSVLRSCSLCGLSYNKGAPDDESLHKSHCTRVQKGMEWGRDEEKECSKAGVVEVSSNVKLKNGLRGRIISFRADLGGKIGSKISVLLNTINLTLSAPDLTPDILRASKVYLFLVPSVASTFREKIIGCVVAQQISAAMVIASVAECTAASKLVAVDTSTGIFCHPDLLPTPLGIPRLFVPSSHRRQGVASKLLTAAAETFIYGCRLDPRKGQVAFTQPTGDGNAVMRQWGGGGVRIYEE
ncbi:N-acetyltransferase ECO1 [Mycena indigotica]|uniref:N-acetyltransferase ECO1 n=1 Tax=Mycena indigotica TaxID=2126181 RepID=A0A8H6S9J2_9AGAR|nr:N-acetyltransferase ECO1 [Mycena indigotica]KAF7295339.1 N-acetyltransferase ECO1 [Mycena indigotica]